MKQGSLPLNDYDLMDCIEKGLGKFGPSIKYAVIWRMIVLGDAPKEGILVKPEAFIAALQSIFGHAAKLIEQAVLEEIKSRRASPEFSGVDNLIDLIKSLREENNQSDRLAPRLVQRT